MDEEIEYENPPYSEVSALEDIQMWSEDKPMWLRDALRRLLFSNELSELDIKELEQICLGEIDESSPFAKKHIAPQRLVSNPVSITRLRDLVGVNALANGQSLSFEHNGLTIVYGDNGSGKSGYVRVLKNACRSRDKKTTILRDINLDEDIPQSAYIDFKVGDEDKIYSWNPENGQHKDLAAVSIFDSFSANIHVENSNTVAYEPFAMGLLYRLGLICDIIDNRLAESIANLTNQTPNAIKNKSLSRDTEAGLFLRNLSAESKEKELDALTCLSGEEKNRLSVLENDLAQDPTKVVEKLKMKIRIFDSLYSKLKHQLTAIENESLIKLNTLISDQETKSKAAIIASESLFREVPLKGIGSDVWRALWEAARKYSDDVAYPGRKFPSPVDNEHCVLCHQPLGKNIQERLMSFETFVKGEAQNVADEAIKELKRYKQHLNSARMSMTDIRNFVTLLESDFYEIETAQKVRCVSLKSAWRLRKLLSGEVVSGDLPSIPSEELNILRNDFEHRITALASSLESEERKSLVSECRELKDRLSLSEIASDIRAEIKRKKEIATISVAREACGSVIKRKITNKNKKLSEKLVTDALMKRFEREVNKLKIGTMPIELRKVRDRDFQSFFRINLVNIPDKPVGMILSEGEYRCVALAAFLAELVTSRDYSGIVFDDPMSSLDHVYRKRVAGRLVEEAQHRQVIVFTHDLTFLFELQRAKENLNVALHFQNVYRQQSKPGYIRNDIPNDAKSAWLMADDLRSELKNVRGNFDNWREVRRSVYAKGIIGNLRIGWENGLAYFIQPVMSRFDRKVNVSSISMLEILNEEDVALVLSAQTRLSEDLHSSPETINPSEVTHADLSSELNKLRNWLQSIKTRRQKLIRAS